MNDKNRPTENPSDNPLDNSLNNSPDDQSNDPEQDLATRFPPPIPFFLLIILVAALTWIIPAGQYDRAMNEEVGREVAVPGTYQTVDPNPQGFMDIMLAPTAGFYDPDSYVANAIDVALFVLFLGGFLGVMNATGQLILVYAAPCAISKAMKSG